MEKIKFSSVDIYGLFQMKDRYKSRTTLLNAEEKGLIPKANRVKHGSVNVRQWSIDQVPDIGRHFGFLKKPNSQKIISIYTAKGGVLKTSYAYTMGKTLALNGVKTLIIGLDIQCSITKIILPEIEINSLAEMREVPLRLGMFHYMYEKVPLNKIIHKTSLPTLDVIPETHDLNMLERSLTLEKRREYFFKDKLIPKLQDYDVVIFDNGPNWNQLTENSLTASNIVISPIGCDVNSYQAIDINLEIIEEFQQTMKLEWSNFLITPTLLETNKLSQQIYAAYVNNYADKIVAFPIRRAIKGQEALLVQQSIFEYSPSSPLANDYFEQLTYIWGLLCDEKETKKSKNLTGKILESST